MYCYYDYIKKPDSPAHKKTPDEEDLQYFSDFRSFESIAPELKTPSKDVKISEEEIKTDEIEEGADERQSFALLRSQKMSTDDYKEFINSRGVGMLYKGKKALCKWLNIPKETASSNNLIEIVSLVAKFALRRIVEEAIRKRSPTGSLVVITEPLTIKEMKNLIDAELKLIKEIVNNVEQSENGFKLFLKDMKKHTEPTKKGIRPESSGILGRAKKEWNKLGESVRKEYKRRMETEKHLKEYLKAIREKGDYVPINEYGKFVKAEIKENGIKSCDSEFFYNVFQKWLKYSKKLEEL